MAECIIARGGGSGGGSNGGLPPVIAGYCQILTTVVDSDNNPIQDLSVHCKDGEAWYNYHTNEKGQVLFVTNSGSANITAWNFSINGNYKYIDQKYNVQNIDAPVTTSKYLNIQLSRVSSFNATSDSTNIYNNGFDRCKFRVANKIDQLQLGSAGGGGGCGYRYRNRVNFSGGGGGGGSITQYNIDINRNEVYRFYIGQGGEGAWIRNNRQVNTGQVISPSSGGSTSGFGYSVTGGRAADIANRYVFAEPGPNGGWGMPCDWNNGINDIIRRHATGSGGGGGGGCGSAGSRSANDNSNEKYNNPIYGGNGKSSGGASGGDGGSRYYRSNGASYSDTAEDGSSGSSGGGGGGGGGGCALNTTSNGDPIEDWDSHYLGGNGGDGSIYLSFS